MVELAIMQNYLQQKVSNTFLSSRFRKSEWRNKSTWTRAHLAFWHIISYENSLALAAHVSKHMPQLRKVYMNFKRILIHFTKQVTCNLKSVPVYVGRIANQIKLPKWLPFENYKSESLNTWCAYLGDICTPNMKFLCPTLWQGEGCTDANDDDVRWTKHD